MKQLYRSYEESTDIFKEYQKKFPNNFKIESIGETWEKREINLITISGDINTADEKPALFYTGTIHAREWIGHELAIEFTKYILENIQHDPTLQKYLKKSTIYMVPCANPDGYEYSRTHFSFWRKNRRVNADGSYGVDLNRNFPIGYVKSTSTTSNVYGGPEPFSEPETKALRDFVETHENITIALDYHSQGNVFFPAHDFRHEDTVDTTDMNILCANMAEEIRKISGREYGIHQGKPPIKLISGSGREFYHSKGIISTVVEVGTRNISDYMNDMDENIREHIPALLVALKETRNYSKKNSLKRVNSFEITEIGSNHVNLKWDYKTHEDIFFEIYRAKRNKYFCKTSNLIARTQALEFTDINLETNKDYFYNIRVVNKKTFEKSPFYPQISLRTDPEYDEFSRTYYATAKETGYVAENLNDNAKHFGINSLFVGVDENKGVSYAIVTVSLQSLAENTIIKNASFNLYPINRVSTTIEKYGEWNVGIVNQDTMGNITNFDDVDNMEIVKYVGRPTQSHQLTQGIWRTWEFSGIECKALQDVFERYGKVVFRVEGPKELIIGRTRQMMQWDIGYGKFGYGLPFRPRLEITYTVKPNIIELYPKAVYTVSKDDVVEDEVSAGFDNEGKKIYSTFEFNLSSLPSFDYTMITKAYFELNSKNIYIKDDIRFHLEFVDENIDKDYNGITNREIIQTIGYDVSAAELKNNQTQYFPFDSYSEINLNEKLKDKSDIAFVLKPTSSQKLIKDKKVSWEIKNQNLSPKLIIEYIPKRRYPIEKVTNAKLTKENGKLKLTWDNPKSPDLKGVKVIKNAFRKPYSTHDGQKLYAGMDNYTFDDFGAKDIDKYYALFTYDEVPNYSEPVIIEYKAN
ncbi:M14 family zinc carboxypeptidase [Halarcobacter sp.]|uniref:M14 family zinc carboxypeptidase n=1 Tax=Halarcobacter sp. TaxID=2321133 RepID=UPI002AAB4DB4|nr:M14 family zinc carboxypeptidase [Halarcobacter sp.]